MRVVLVLAISNRFDGLWSSRTSILHHGVMNKLTMRSIISNPSISCRDNAVAVLSIRTLLSSSQNLGGTVAIVDGNGIRKNWFKCVADHFSVRFLVAPHSATLN